MATRRALLSVSNKNHVVPFARALSDLGFELLSTGGTAKLLSDEGIAVIPVEAYTGSPEVMGGRVKTLHPAVHGGILARLGRDEEDLARVGGKLIDMVVVNLYPFEQTVARGDATDAEVIENIDIGGPSMLRSASKNHERVAVVCDPSDYDRVIDELRAGDLSRQTRRELAAKAFAQTAAYDAAIARYLSTGVTEEGPELFPRFLTMPFERGYHLRYGENPHQRGAFYRDRNASVGTIAMAESLGAGGKELSYNNFVDLDAALEAVREFEQPAAVVVKHTNPCGVATADTLEQAYRVAREADAVSAFGGIVALNRKVDLPTAIALAETFLEGIVAPGFTQEALEKLRKKKNLRLLDCAVMLPPDHASDVYRRIGGGIVVQQRDATARGEVEHGKVVTKRAPTDEEMRALAFGWKVVKHVKSNAIVLARESVTVGVGAGQMSRVESVTIACRKAGDAARGTVLASDAFFPFPDGIELAAAHGVTAVVQPGGSVKDDLVIEAADKAGLAMVFTGKRHFRH
ncbi:MAG: bifunctional phosphoribosylaminoimidazolecarboxamide formyltransferase/inosine monophosphate cyclohydrolase [Deltaproteobacteria bacterium HGW-Deltaproteobacteria-20]|nr:MAG: bifunctional phosphoribosylaminoimidazolecarboxamide formyltransferase/inosine monophosphate cyclohydrolase [Deltaproteobacteria bacterium HGW-Deltaproteobacteria-20]